MKIQFLIFFTIIGVIVFLVYQGDQLDVEQAKHEIDQRRDIQQERNNDDYVDSIEDKVESQEIVIESQDIARQSEDTQIQESYNNDNQPHNDSNDNWQQESFDDNKLPAPSLNVQDIFSIQTPNFIEYGDPIKTSDTSFVYNQVRWLEVFMEYIDQELSCDDLTEFLTERLQAWYFWNTCRFISWDRWLKFNVLRLTWDEYVYERHYIDRVSWMYWILILDTGEGIDNDMLPEKNIEFRDTEFPLIEIWDGLMAELVRAN